MEVYRIENLSFKYPDTENEAISNVSISINKGEFITVCGKSGCGKSTLLRQLKPLISPYGKKSGEVFFDGKNISELNQREQSENIGFVLQNPDNQIVCNKVWHELAFGLESLGFIKNEIRSRVAEMASYFGIHNWFYKDVCDLSGGQKQLLNLAAVMVMQPKVIILDEPTSQLDPIAAANFLRTLKRINQEFGITVILSEHRLEEALPLSDRVVVMEEGKIIADSIPCEIYKKLENNDMMMAMPTPVKVYSAIKSDLPCPVTVKEGRDWLSEVDKKGHIKNKDIKHNDVDQNTPVKAELKDIWFRYEKNSPDVLKGLNLKIRENELYAIVGANGAGKTTALSIMCGIITPYRGKILINGIEKGDSKNAIAMLPQNPQVLFVKKTVHSDLEEILSDKAYSKEEKEDMISDVLKLCELEELKDRHPYDLSGGEQQRAALAKVLLTNPKILLLDEPTKGLDAHFKEKLAAILHNLKKNDITIIMISHDVEFCAKYADRCSMFFDGQVMAEDSAKKFFCKKFFYTTAANRMARDIIPDAVLDEDILKAMGKTYEKKEILDMEIKLLKIKPKQEEKTSSPKRKLTKKNIFFGAFFALLFVLTIVVFNNKYTDYRNLIYQLVTIIEAALCVYNFIPQREIKTTDKGTQNKKLKKGTLISIILLMVLVPLTILFGMYFLDDKKYYFISLLIILETFFSFIFMFEDKKPHAREIVLISVLCAIAIAGRGAFSVIPQFKPVIALVIIAAVCFGAPTGFLVGAVTGFLSNFFFGQGPWTPWQMFAFGMVGLVAGIIFQKGFVEKTKGALSILGAVLTVVVFGGIVNTGTVLMYQPSPTIEMFISSYVLGFPFDLIHAAATVFFLWFGAEPMIEKLERVKNKYGIGK